MTDTGGDVLFIEANVVKSSGAKGGLTLTGQLGDVMKESAIPKDGPSVGITTTTALASLLTGCPRAARRGLAA